MKMDKIKEILKNKKAQLMAGTVAGVLIFTIAGSILLHNKFNGENKVEDSKVVTLNKENTEEEKDIKEKSNKEENLTNEITSNEETKTEDNKSESTSNTVVENISNDTSSSNTTLSNSSTNTNSNKTSTNSVNSGTIYEPSINTYNSTSDTGSYSNNSTPVHTHSWAEVYKDVYHEEEGHYENVLVKEAWTETIPVYEEKIVGICNGCGKDITGQENAHMKEQMLAGNYSCGSWRDEVRQVQIGTNTINHDAVYEKKWIIDRAAWTEKVLSGYKCSSCGETK